MNDVIVQTRSGAVRGVMVGGIGRFLGVPYAQPPVGSLRFEKPQPHAPWPDVFDARQPGPTAPQLQPPGLDEFPIDVEHLVGGGWRQGEDFLAAAIWTPDTKAQGLPVMVFIHGGGFVAGGYDAAIIDGTAFARDGVVLVSINYRLGVEGFVALPDAPTNLGLRDQIAALAWVRENIAAFGGDPANVTVFGESAGAMSIGNLIASPLATGLFRRAIVQSGHGSMVRPINVARRLTRRLARMAGVTPDRAGFASRSPADWLDPLRKVQLPTSGIDLRDETGREPAYGLSRFLPVYGDDVLPQPPLKALANGAGKDVELLIGSNRAEMNLYFVPTGAREKIGRLLAWIALRGKERRAWSILRAYRQAMPGIAPGRVFTEAMSDLVFRLPARAYAAAHRGRTHFYEFGWHSPAFGGELGACHAMELPFVFDTLAGCTGERGLAGPNPPQALADRMHGLWVEFARSGRLDWPEYDAASRHVFRIENGEAAPEPPLIAERFWR